MKKLNFKRLFKKFSATWLALDPNTNKVVATASSPKIAIKKANKAGVSHPVLTRAPKENMVNILANLRVSGSANQSSSQLSSNVIASATKQSHTTVGHNK